MTVNLSRRKMMQAAGAIALAPSVVAAEPAVKRWPIVESSDTPRLCLGLGDGGRARRGKEDEGIRRIRQLGVDYVLGGGRRIPWQEADLRARIERLRTKGITGGANMTYLRDHRYRWHVLVGMILAIGLFGCSPLPRQGAGLEPPVVPAEPNEASAQSEKITLSLEFEPGTKTRYRVTTEAVTAMEGPETAVQDNASTAPFPKVSESSEVVFTQEILGPVSEETNTVVALVTIEEVRYVRTSPVQPGLAFDSQEPADQNSPFAKLIGQTYTIEISPLGYVPGVFNLLSARLAVRGSTPAHAAALELVSPPAIFRRHGFFSLPGPDVGSLAVGGQWRGVQQITLKAPGADMDRLGTHRFDKIYRLESVEQRPVGAVAVVVFAGSPRPRRSPDGHLAEVPFLSCSYVGGGEFNLDAGRVEDYLEHLEVRMPLPGTGSPPAEGPEGRIVIATRFCRVQRLDLD